MSILDLSTVCRDLPPAWRRWVRDWDRTLRSASHPETTRYNYLIAVAQLGRYLGEHLPDPEAAAAAQDPVAVTRAHVEAFQGWLLDTRAASTAVNKHKCLQQFFKWLLLDEEAIEHNPMRRVRQPRVGSKPVAIMRDEETVRILRACGGKTFLDLRDAAIIRLLYNTGARLSEIAGLQLEDVDLERDTVYLRGKGAKDRRVRIGPKTARAVSRYLRARAARAGAGTTWLWLGKRGARPLAPNGIKIMLRRRGVAAGVPGVHAHRWRHNYAHEWKRHGGDTGDLMVLLGWSSDDMARHYGASAAAERAQETQMRLGIGETI